MKIGNLEVEKILIGNQEVEKILLGADDIWEPESGAPSSNTYYYQISGGSLVEMTFDGVDSYYVSGLTLLPVYTNAIRFYKNNELISAGTINSEQSVGEFGTMYAFYEMSDDEYLGIAYPITSISLKEVDDPTYAYQTECTVAPVYVEIDASVNEMDFDGGSYSYSTDSWKCPGTTYKIKTLNTYADIVVPDHSQGTQINYGSAYTPDYCVDEGTTIDMAGFNYYESTLTTYEVSIMEGGSCKPHFYYNGSDSWIDANDYEEVDLEETSMSVTPGDTIGIMDAAGNLPCGCLQITIKDEEDNTLGTQLAGEEWTNDTNNTYTKAERRDCDLVLKISSGE